jgi:DNA-binding transcriptional MerR regulator
MTERAESIVAPDGQAVFSLAEIALSASMSYRVLNMWLREGLFEPSIRADAGSGNAGVYSEEDRDLILRLIELRRRGLELRALKVVATVLRRHRCAECPICREGEIDA